MTKFNHVFDLLRHPDPSATGEGVEGVEGAEGAEGAEGIEDVEDVGQP
ncbi:hypothetical protein [Streptomyces sp. Root1310]|nr:hypothetical protein [Streptomyces sp. Root1310]